MPRHKRKRPVHVTTIRLDLELWDSVVEHAEQRTMPINTWIANACLSAVNREERYREASTKRRQKTGKWIECPAGIHNRMFRRGAHCGMCNQIHGPNKCPACSHNMSPDQVAYEARLANSTLDEAPPRQQPQEFRKADTAERRWDLQHPEDSVAVVEPTDVSNHSQDGPDIVAAMAQLKQIKLATGLTVPSGDELFGSADV
jgi:hypothetical protein